MSKAYQVRVLVGDHEGSVVKAGTAVYADSELEAKAAGAAELGVSMDRVQVEVIPDVWVPTDDELRRGWDPNG